MTQSPTEVDGTTVVVRSTKPTDQITTTSVSDQLLYITNKMMQTYGNAMQAVYIFLWDKIIPTGNHQKLLKRNVVLIEPA